MMAGVDDLAGRELVVRGRLRRGAWRGPNARRRRLRRRHGLRSGRRGFEASDGQGDDGEPQGKIHHASPV
jgi:hypothetical protein